MLITHKIQMDLQRFGIMPYLEVVCGDAYTRQLELSLFSGGSAWTVPEDVSAVVRYSRSDGYGGLYDKLPDGNVACTITGNMVTAILAPQVLSAPGFAKVSVALVNGDLVLGTFPVGINIKEDPSMGVTKGENYYNYPSIGAINDAIGDLSHLQTANKSSLVAAINEAAKTGGNGSGGAGFVVDDTAPEDTSLLWVDPNDNSTDDFQEAVNTALAQAKASGEFDGADGQPGKDGKDGQNGSDYVLTDADKQEIAELVAPLVDVPSGGSSGSAKAWRKIAEYTLEEDLTADTWFSIDNDGDGSELDLSESLLIIVAKTDGSNGDAYYQASKPNDQNINYVIMNLTIRNGSEIMIHCEAIGFNGKRPLYLRTTYSENTNAHAALAKAIGMRKANSPITGANFRLPKDCLVGTKYEFWGVDR